MKRFVVVRVCKEAVLCRGDFHEFEGKVHLWNPTKSFLSQLAGERCKNVFPLKPHALVVVDSTKKTMNSQEIFGVSAFVNCHLFSYAMALNLWVLTNHQANQFLEWPICFKCINSEAVGF